MDDQRLAESTFATPDDDRIGNLLGSRDLMARIALQLANLTQFGDKIRMILASAGEALDVSRVYIFEDDHAKGITNNTFEWCAGGIAPEIDNLKGIPLEIIQNWYEVIGTNGYLSANDISILPANIREILEPQGIVSIVVFKLVLPGGESGFIGFDECKVPRMWRKDELDILITMASIIQSLYEQDSLQRKVHENESNFQSMFNTITDFIVVADTDGYLITCNQAVKDRLLPRPNGPKDDRLHILDFHHDRQKPRAIEVLAEMMRGERTTCNIPLLCAQGREIPVLTTIWFGHWNDQDAIFGISKDLSAEQHALERFNKLFDHNPLPLWVIDIEFNSLQSVNQAFVETTGYAKEEILGKDIRHLGMFTGCASHDDMPQKHTDLSHIERNCRLQTRDGTILEGMVSRTMFRSDDSRLELGVFTDLTKQLLLQTEVERQKTKLEHIIESTNLGTWEWDIRNNTITVNQRWAEMLGYTLEELGETTIDTWRTLVHPEDLPLVDRQLQAHLSGEIPQYNTEYRLRQKSGSCIWIQDIGKVMEQDSKGKPIRMFGSHSDLTKIKKAQVELIEAKTKAEQLNEMKSKFIAMLSHEIRTPVHTIAGIAELLSRTDAAPRQLIQFDRLKKAAMILLDTVNHLLDMTQIEAGKINIKAVRFSLQHLIEDIVQVHSIRCAQRNLELRVEIHPDTPLDLTGDPTRITQVLVNLLGNAEKFTQEGSITLRVHPVDRQDDEDRRWIELEVADTGRGIHQEKLEQIFDPYYRVAPADPQSETEGTGLGLSLSSHMTALMGGTITVESTVGRGSVFSVQLPFPKQRTSTPRVLADALVDSLPPICCVSDKESMPECAMILAQLGIPCTTMSFEQLCTMGTSHTPHLLVIDDEDLYQRPFNLDHVETYGKKHPKTLLIIVSQVLRDPVIPVHAHHAKVVHRPLYHANLLSAAIGLYDEIRFNTPRSSPESCGTRKTGRILICEDHAVNAEILKELIEGHGHQADVVGRGIQAVEQLQKEPYDLLFLDIQMPGIDGFETARMIRKNLGNALPIVALSAHALDEYRRKSVEAGIDRYLVKPVDTTMLAALLQELLPEHCPRLGNKLLLERNKDVLTLAKAMDAEARKLYGVYVVAALERCSYQIGQYFTYVEDLVGELSSVQHMCGRDDLKSEELAKELHAVAGLAANLGFVEPAASLGACEARLTGKNQCPTDLSEFIDRQIQMMLEKIHGFVIFSKDKFSEAAISDTINSEKINTRLKNRTGTIAAKPGAMTGAATGEEISGKQFGAGTKATKHGELLLGMLATGDFEASLHVVSLMECDSRYIGHARELASIRSHVESYDCAGARKILVELLPNVKE